ncbi:MAG TPA: elongation factor 1-beta [Nitrososphaeraceae archaeon]|jgi:Translation elongation factor EF-1beta|nr:elongation factor 1-beta [Nitrososphaeraceae archaeon]
MYYCGDVKAVENLHDCINVLTVVSKALKMSRLIARIKILPLEADTDLDEVISKLKSNIPNEMGLERYGKEPIAFGLNSLICDFSLNDVEGQMDSLEEYIKKTPGVSEIQVMNISRKSVNIK